nr:magnesium/cobalt transporter CorA [Gammaproteobacteria bacterium]
MKQTTSRRSHKAGLPPGTLVHIGERKRETARIRLLQYNAQHLEESEPSVEKWRGLRRTGGITWIHVTGVHDIAVLAAVGEYFGLHPLVLEDILNTDQRPKREDYEDYTYLVIKALQYGSDGQRLVREQVSIVLGRDFVLSFEENEPSLFEPVRQQLLNKHGRIRELGADYLAYRLVDAVVDGYFGVLERFGEHIETLQDRIMRRPSGRSQQVLYHLRREIMLVRRFVWPLREVIGGLEREGGALIQEGTRIYLRDVYDHVLHMIETIEAFHEMLAYTLDIHLLGTTHRLNEIIKVLTVIATAFMPPTLIASIYGMNFRVMPEISWTWGYPLAIGVMLGTVSGMLVYFRRKHWL